MQEELINEEDVIKCLKKMKAKKAVGPDGIKPGFLKVFIKSRPLLVTLVRTLKQSIQMAEVPDSWKESTTVLIPKTQTKSE